MHDILTGAQWCDTPESIIATLILLYILDKLLLLGDTATISLPLGATSVKVVVDFNVVLVLGKKNIVVVLIFFWLILLHALGKLLLLGDTATIYLSLGVTGVKVVVEFNVVLVLCKNNIVVILIFFWYLLRMILFWYKIKKLALGTDKTVLVQGKNLLILGSDNIVWYEIFEIVGKEEWGRRYTLIFLVLMIKKI